MSVFGLAYFGKTIVSFNILRELQKIFTEAFSSQMWLQYLKIAVYLSFFA